MRIRRPRPYQLTFGFGQLSPVAVHYGVDGYSFIHCHTQHEKILFNALKRQSLTSCCFWSPLSKRGTHFENSFPLDKMVNTLPSDNFKVPAISRNFYLQSAKTNFWTFFYILWNNYRIWTTKALSTIVICTGAFKISSTLLYRLSGYGVRISIFKP